MRQGGRLMHPITCKCGGPCSQRRREAEAVLTQVEKDSIIRAALYLSPRAKELAAKAARAVKSFGYG